MDVEVSPYGSTIAFGTNEAGSSRLYLLDAQTRRYRAVQGLPNALMSGVHWRADGSELGFAMTSPRSNADAYSLNVASGEIVRWTESELNGVIASELSEAELIRWPSFDGARSRSLRVLRADRAGQQRAQDHEAAVRRAGW